MRMFSWCVRELEQVGRWSCHLLRWEDWWRNCFNLNWLLSRCVIQLSLWVSRCLCPVLNFISYFLVSSSFVGACTPITAHERERRRFAFWVPGILKMSLILLLNLIDTLGRYRSLGCKLSFLKILEALICNCGDLEHIYCCSFMDAVYSLFCKDSNYSFCKNWGIIDWLQF